jgi:hypothetical protein
VWVAHSGTSVEEELETQYWIFGRQLLLFGMLWNFFEGGLLGILKAKNAS